VPLLERGLGGLARQIGAWQRGGVRYTSPPELLGRAARHVVRDCRWYHGHGIAITHKNVAGIQRHMTTTDRHNALHRVMPRRVEWRARAATEDRELCHFSAWVGVAMPPSATSPATLRFSSRVTRGWLAHVAWANALYEHVAQPGLNSCVAEHHVIINR